MHDFQYVKFIKMPEVLVVSLALSFKLVSLNTSFK